MAIKILELENEQAFDALAELIDPLNEILTDTELRDIANNGGNALGIIKRILKEHKQSIIQIIATLDGVGPEDCKVTIFSLLARFKELRELYYTSGIKDLFTSQAQTND